MLASGISKGSRLGLLMPNSPDFVVAWLAAARIGAIIVPINTFYKPRELAFVLHHADIQVLLTADKLLNNDYLERLETCIPQLLQQPHRRRLEQAPVAAGVSFPAPYLCLG